MPVKKKGSKTTSSKTAHVLNLITTAADQVEEELDTSSVTQTAQAMPEPGPAPAPEPPSMQAEPAPAPPVLQASPPAAPAVPVPAPEPAPPVLQASPPEVPQAKVEVAMDDDFLASQIQAALTTQLMADLKAESHNFNPRMIKGQKAEPQDVEEEVSEPDSVQESESVEASEPESVAEAESVEEPEAEPVAEAESVEEPEAEPVAEAEPVEEPEAEPVAEAEPEAEPEEESMEEPVAEAEPEAESVEEPEAEAEPVEEPEAESVAEAESVEEPEAEVEAEAEPVEEPEAEPVAEEETESAEAEPEAESVEEPEAEVEAESEPESVAEEETVTEEAEAEPESVEEPEAEPVAEPVAEAEPEEESMEEPIAEAEPEEESVAESVAESVTEAEPESVEEPVAEAEPVVEPEPVAEEVPESEPEPEPNVSPAVFPQVSAHNGKENGEILEGGAEEYAPPSFAGEDVSLPAPAALPPRKTGTAPAPLKKEPPVMPPMPTVEDLKPLTTGKKPPIPPEDILDMIDSKAFDLHNEECALSSKIQGALNEHLTEDEEPTAQSAPSIFLDPILPPEATNPSSISLAPSAPMELGSMPERPLDLMPQQATELLELSPHGLEESDAIRNIDVTDHSNPMVGRRLGEPVEYYNLTEILVRDLAPNSLQTFGTCTCDQCLLDVIAHCLSRLPPKYVVRYHGGYDQIYEDYKQEYGSAIVSQLGKSCIFINETPRHLKAFMTE